MPASLSVTDLKLLFMSRQLGISVASLQDIEKKFYETYQLGGLALTGGSNTFTGLQNVGALAVTGNETVGGTLAVTGATRLGATGLNGNVAVGKAAAVVAPTASGAAYAQAEAQSTVTAVNSIIAALQAVGITL